MLMLIYARLLMMFTFDAAAYDLIFMFFVLIFDIVDALLFKMSAAQPFMPIRYMRFMMLRFLMRAALDAERERRRPCLRDVAPAILLRARMFCHFDAMSTRGNESIARVPRNEEMPQSTTMFTQTSPDGASACKVRMRAAIRRTRTQQSGDMRVKDARIACPPPVRL